ncbi:MAG: hypothetical protein K6E35_07875 [Bacteroidales bacterium]|nr:hypothetical protein [Bacteroidales bacterium]
MAEKLSIGIWLNGRSYPIWRYEILPEGVRQATSSDLTKIGTPVLYQVFHGPDAGSWYTDIVRPATQYLLGEKLASGCEVYVKI